MAAEVKTREHMSYVNQFPSSKLLTSSRLNSVFQLYKAIVLDRINPEGLSHTCQRRLALS